MPGRDECNGCGATLPSGASRCLRCGRVDPAVATTVALERLDAPLPVPPTISSQRTVVGTDGPGERKRTVATAAGLLAVVVAAVLVLASGGGGGDGAGDEDAAMPSTDVPTTSDAPTSTRRASTTRAPTTTSTTTTLISYPGAVGRPMLGERTGLSLYVARGTALFRLELDNGTLTELPLPRALEAGVRTIERRGDRLLIDTGYVSWYETGFDLRGGVVQSDEPRLAGQVLHGTTRLWSTSISEGSVETVSFWDAADPSNVVDHTLPSGSRTHGSVGARVLVQGGGRLYTLDVHGTIRPYAQGTVVGSGGMWLLWQSCDEQLRCRVRLGDETNPDARTVATPSAWPFGAGGYGGASIAPDGRTAVLSLANGPVLADLTTGEVLDVAFSWDSYVWSDDSRWFFRVGRGLDVEAVSTETGQVIVLFRPPTDGQNEYTVLEIG